MPEVTPEDAREATEVLQAEQRALEARARRVLGAPGTANELERRAATLALVVEWLQEEFKI